MVPQQKRTKQATGTIKISNRQSSTQKATLKSYLILGKSCGFFVNNTLTTFHAITKMDYKTFETDRLLIRPTTEDDAEFIFALLNTKKWIEYIGDRHVKTIESAKNYIAVKMRPQLERLGFSNYTLILKANSQKIGTCGLYNRAGLAGIDIGFALLPDYEKMGLAFEAANRIKKAAFDDFQLKTISGLTTKENLSSQKLLEKLGLKRVGTTTLPNDPEILLLYKLEK